MIAQQHHTSINESPLLAMLSMEHKARQARHSLNVERFQSGKKPLSTVKMKTYLFKRRSIRRRYDKPIGPQWPEPVQNGSKVIREIAEKHNISHEDITGPSRFRKYVRPRQEAMYLIYINSDWSLPRIGRLFGNRDHTTVLHSVRVYSKLNGLSLDRMFIAGRNGEDG